MVSILHLSELRENHTQTKKIQATQKTHTQTHTETHTHARTHKRTHACTHARTHLRTHSRAHGRTHARTHTHVCTHSRTHTRTKPRSDILKKDLAELRIVNKSRGIFLFTYLGVLCLYLDITMKTNFKKIIKLKKI